MNARTAAQVKRVAHEELNIINTNWRRDKQSLMYGLLMAKSMFFKFIKPDLSIHANLDL